MVKFNGKSIYERNVIVFICLLFFVEPNCFTTVGWLDRIYTYGGFVCIIFLIFLLIFQCICVKKISLVEIWIFLFFGIIFISTVINGRDVYYFAKDNYPLLGTCLLFDLWLEYNPKGLINTSEFLNIYVYINLITVLLFPEGMYNSGVYSENWFLGYKNPQIRIILPILVLELIRSYWKYGRISMTSYILLACSLITFLLVDSAGAVVGFIVFAVLLALFHRRNKPLPKFVNIFNGIIAMALIFMGMAFLQLQNRFTWLIENILGRDVTITTRTRIWASAFSRINDKFSIGYGYMSPSEFSSLLGGRYATHPHNFLLYLLMIGGVLLLIVFLIGVIYADYKMFKNNDNIYNKIILFALYAFLVMGIAESLISTVLFYPLFILAMKSDKIAELKYGERLGRGNHLNQAIIRIKPH